MDVKDKDVEDFTALEDVIDGDIDKDDDEGLISFEDDDDDKDPAFGYEEPEQEEEQPEPEQDTDVEPEQQEDPEKREQSPEENAYFAELRRQREAQERQIALQQQVEQMRQNMPEFQVAQLLSQQYGVSPQEMLYRLQEAQLAQEAEALGVHPQTLRQQKQMQEQMQRQMIAQQQYQEQMQQLMTQQNLMLRLQRESVEVQRQHPTLTPDDLTDAVIWAYENNSMHLPLDAMVRAKHADKLFSVSQEQAKQQALAEVSGRMSKSIQPPSGKAPSTSSGLTSQEKYFAKMMGVSEADYLANKTR